MSAEHDEKFRGERKGDAMDDQSVERRRLIFPGLAGLYESFAPYSYSLMRFAAGAVLVPHGIQKIMNSSWTTLAPYIEKQMGVANPLWWAYMAVFTESVCDMLGDWAFHSSCRIDSPNSHGNHHRLFPMAVRLLLDQQGYRIRAAVVALIPRHFLRRRRALLSGPVPQEGILMYLHAMGLTGAACPHTSASLILFRGLIGR
jgi:hypothetical protein